jgi:hypothetical protein
MLGRHSRNGLVAVLAALPSFADAATCLQDHAIYGDRDNAYELAFQSGRSDAEVSTHRFSLRVLENQLVLDGYVMADEDSGRSAGLLFFNCPEGDVTGADLRACTIWQGAVYGNKAGTVGQLPDGSDEAADEILLPDLGVSVQRSAVVASNAAPAEPWDVLTFKGCAQ